MALYDVRIEFCDGRGDYCIRNIHQDASDSLPHSLVGALEPCSGKYSLSRTVAEVLGIYDACYESNGFRNAAWHSDETREAYAALIRAAKAYVAAMAGGRSTKPKKKGGAK